MGEQTLTQRYIFLIEGLQQVKTTIDLSKQLNKQFLSLTQTASQFKSAGKVLIETFDALSRSGDKTQIVIRSVDKQVKTLSTTFRENAQAAALAKKRFDEDAASAKQLEQRIQGLRAIGAISELFKTFAASANLTPQAIVRVNLALSRLQSQIQKTSLTGPQITKLFNDIRAGTNRVFTEQERRLVPSLQQVANGFKKTGEQGVKSAKAVTLSWTTFARAVLVSQVLRAFNLVRQAFTQSIEQAAEFQVAITEIRTLSLQNQLASEQWAESLREVSDSFGIPILNVAEAAYQTLSNQIAKGADVQQFLIEASRFSQAAVTDLTTSVNLLTGALNSFQLDTEQTARVSAVLFKTIELGRIRAEDMSNTFGRTGVLANQLGIRIEELGALFASSTIQGIRFNEAQTLVRNLMLKLIKPTDEFNKVLNDMGVSSGEAAIATFGLEGVLIRIGEELEKGGLSRIGELFGRVRAISAATLFGREGAKGFSDTLRQFETSLGSFATAVELRFESAGAQLQRELNEIKNFLVVDFGQSVLETIRGFTDQFGGITGTIQVFAKALTVAAVAFAAFKTSAAISSVDIVASLGAFIGGLRRLRSALLITQITFSATFVGAIIAGSAAIVAAIILFTKSAEEELQDFRDVLSEDIQRTEKLQQEALQRSTRAIRKAIAERTRIVLKFAATIRKEFRQIEEDQERAVEAINSQLEIAIRATLDTIRGSIRELETEARNAQKRADEATARQRDIPIRFEVAQFERALSDADLTEQVKLLQDRISKITEKLIDVTTVDIVKLDVDKTLILFGELEQRLQSLFRLRQRADQEITRNTQRLTDLIQRAQKIREDGEVRIGKLQSQLRRAQIARTDPERRRQIIENISNAEKKINVRLAENFKQQKAIEESNAKLQTIKLSRLEIERELNGLLEARLALDEKIRIQADKTAKKAEEQAEQRRKDFEVLREAFKRLIALDLDAVRDLAGSGASTEKIRKEINEQIDALLNSQELARSKNQDVILRITQLGEEKRLTLLRKLRSQEAKEELDNQVQIAQQKRKILEDSIAEQEKRLKRLNQLSSSFGLEAQATLALLSSRLGEASADTIQNIITQATKSLNVGLIISEVKRLETALSEAQADVAIALQDPGALRKQGVSPAVKEAQQRVRELQLILNTARQVRVFLDIEVTRISEQKIFDDATKSLRGFTKAIDSLITKKSGIELVTDSLKKFVEALEGIKQTAFSLQQLGINISSSTGTETVRRNSGGIIGGSGRGDTVPALLTPGEFVMNREATQKFLPQLIAMNKRRFQAGGPVSTSSSLTVNVGGIHTQPGQELSEEQVVTAFKRALFKKRIRII